MAEVHGAMMGRGGAAGSMGVGGTGVELSCGREERVGLRRDRDSGRRWEMTALGGYRRMYTGRGRALQVMSLQWLP